MSPRVVRGFSAVMLSLVVANAAGADEARWREYEENSRRQAAHDTAVLKAEVEAAGMIRPLRPAKGSPFAPDFDAPAEWWSGEAARALIRTVLAFQTPSGGWSKGVNYHREERRRGEAYSPDDASARETAGTVDNGTTTREMRFLAQAAAHTGRRDCIAAVARGFDFLLAAQYPNGGWPQFYPLVGDYHDGITFNDDAIAKVLLLLDEMARGEGPFSFLDQSRRERAGAAHARGIECVLAAQVKLGGQRTGWCAQYEPRQLEPAKGRAYEPVALASAETSRLMQVLMSLSAPGPTVIEAVNGAGAWLTRVQIHGVRVEKRVDPKFAKGWDRVVVADPAAMPVWARFYEIPSQRPMFACDDGTVKYSLAEIDYGRRVGYDWYDVRPADVVGRQWPEWKRAHGLAGGGAAR